jgi:DNA repair protein SbcD/Mre11
VDCALEHRVDAVLLAGDVVDQDNRYFEAYGPLGGGTRRLKEAGIAVVAVAGNHDHHTLHQVAAEVSEGHLVVLGQGGRWERWTLRDADGAARLHVDGWSFPAAHHHADPTASHHLPPPDDGAPVVGLLHCDVDSSDTRYAPVTAAALTRVPVTAWVLGHVHAPRLREEPGRAPVLYPGSLLALRPVERGPRGAWLVEVAPGRAPRFRQIPLSAVRYDIATVDLEGVAEQDGVRAAVVAAVAGRLETLVNGDVGPLEVVSCRVHLTGRTPLHSRLGRLLADLGDLDLAERHGVRLVVERIVAETRPALDLDDLARGSDAPALLARLLLELDDAGGGVADEALGRAARAAAGILSRPYYSGLAEPSDADPDPGLQAVVRRQASQLLDELVRQKEAV